ncbi:MAG TPA: hypothetical protein VK138_05895 [Acidiferrobacterales bacterium]|nr:hypothetical protein [Acidiferrobacterales bacterium]
MENLPGRFGGGLADHGLGIIPLRRQEWQCLGVAELSQGGDHPEAQRRIFSGADHGFHRSRVAQTSQRTGGLHGVVARLQGLVQLGHRAPVADHPQRLDRTKAQVAVGFVERGLGERAERARYVARSI